MGYHLDRHRTVGEIAKMVGKPERTTRRWLVTLHARHGNVLTEVQKGNRKAYRTTVRAIRAVVPQMFLEPDVMPAEIESIRMDMASIKRRMNALAADQKAFRKKAWEWFNRAAKSGH